MTSHRSLSIALNSHQNDFTAMQKMTFRYKYVQYLMVWLGNLKHKENTFEETSL